MSAVGLSSLTSASHADTGSGLAGSPFNGSDGKLDTTPAGKISVTGPDPTGEVTLGGGGKEDDDCVGLGTGSPSPKDDLENTYVGTAPGTNGHAFIYLAWTRASTEGTTTIDFEINQGSQSCNDGSGFVHRMDGDQLFTFDFTGGGGTVTINLRTWSTALGKWGDPVVLTDHTIPAAEGSVDATGLFGEMAIDLNVDGFFGAPGICKVAPTVIAKTRSSASSFTNQVKDTTLAIPLNVSNCATLNVNKVDGQGQPVDGAVFGLFTDSNATIPVTVQAGNAQCTTAGGTTGVNPTPATCSFTDVVPGDYFVKEISAPTGYSPDTAITAVTAVTDTTTTVSHTYVDPRHPGSVSLTKTDDTGAPLNGATFGIFTDQAATQAATVLQGGNQTCTTSGGSSGPPAVAAGCSFTGLLPGTYYVKETQAPSHYQPSSVVAQVTVTSDTTTAISTAFVDPRNPGSVKVNKTDDLGNGVNGATFGLYTTQSTTTLVNPNATCTTAGGAAGVAATCTISGILPGTYYVKEISAPTHYAIDPTVSTAVVTSDTTTTVSTTFVDPRNPGSVVVTKTDDTGASLGGATFGLYSNAGATTLATTLTNTGNNTCVTAANTGTCTFAGVLPGTYWVKEISAPAHYTADPSIQGVTVASDQTAAPAKAFVDPRHPGSVSLSKVDDAGAGVNGATFGIFSDAATQHPATVNPGGNNTCLTAGGTASTAATCTFNGLLPGTYYVTETGVPAHHSGDATVATVTVTSDSTFTITKAFIDPRNPGSVSLSKVDDTGAGVNGAVFGIFTDQAATTPAPINQGGNNTCTTSGGTAQAAASCSFTGLLPGTYYVTETSAPAHYAPDTTVATVTVQSDQTLTISRAFVDPRNPGAVLITKTDDAGTALGGALFGLYSDAKATVLVSSCTTAANTGTCTISPVVPGTYYVKEISAPAHYDTDPTIQQVSVVSDQTAAPTNTFVDPRHPGAVSLSKVDDAGAGVNGAGFGIFSDAQATVPAPVNVGGNAACTTSGGTAGQAAGCTFTGLLPGTYFVKETSVPSGYAGDPAIETVTVTSDTTTPVSHQFVDPRLSSALSVLKTVNGNSTTTQANPLVVEQGTTLNYVVTVTNTGQLPLTITALADTLKANLPSTCTQGLNSTLAVGASFTCSYSTTAGQDATNVASATGTDMFGRTPTDQSSTFVQVLNPVIAIAKTAVTQAHVGDTVAYTLTVTNPGNTPLATVAVSDPLCAAAPVLQSKTGGNQDSALDPGEKWTYTCDHVVVTADGSSLVNTATATGVDVLGTTVTSNGQTTTAILHPAISITKTANPVSVTDSGPVTYTYVVTNTGDTTLTDVTVTDDIIGSIGSLGTLAPGASGTLTKTVTVDSTTPPTNTGTATGTDPLGEKVTAQAKASISVVLGETITQPQPPAVAPETLPRTGAPLQAESELALTMLFLGGISLGFSRSRRHENEENEQD